MGQVRPPKEGERYLALLKVEQVNFEEPEKTKHRIAFDNLRPRYPDARIRLERKNSDLSMRVVDLLSPHRQGPARPDRGAAQGRQDDPDAEAGQRHQREPPGDRPHRAAHRRAARGSHRHGGERQGGGHLLHLRRAGRPPRAGGRHGDREGQAAGGARPRRRDPARLDHPPGPGPQRGGAPLGQDPLRRRGRQRAAEAEALLRRRPQHRQAAARSPSSPPR